MAIDLVINKRLPRAMAWFDKFHPKIFDWLEIPNATEQGRAFRAAARKRIAWNLAGERIPDDGRVMHCALFSEQMKKVMANHQDRGQVASNSASMAILSGSECLERVWNLSIGISKGYSEWKASTDPGGWGSVSARELICQGADDDSSNWREVWKWAGGKLSDGRMIAHPQSVIWMKLSRFGVPWPPFEEGCGARVRSIGCGEVAALGFTDGRTGQKVSTGWWDLEER